MSAGTYTRLLALEGDGIGPEIVRATRTVLDAADARFDLHLHFEERQIGLGALEAYGTTMPDDVLAAAMAADGIVLGPVSHNIYPPVEDGGINPSARLRTGLDLYANIRPAFTPAGVEARAPMDLVIVRENTEGFYADRNMAGGSSGEIMPDPDLALAIRKVSRRASRRIAETAFAIASSRPKRHVTAVHKANVLRKSDGLFLEEVRAVASLHPSISYDEVLVDAMAAHLVREPSRYDVIVTTNMFGDILSDLATELAGGLGLAGSLNAGDTRAMAQAQHGSAPDIAGLNLANPASLIASAAMLLDWFGKRRSADEFSQAAAAIRSSLASALSDRTIRTPDVGGCGTTEGMARAVACLVEQAKNAPEKGTSRRGGL